MIFFNILDKNFFAPYKGFLDSERQKSTHEDCLIHTQPLPLNFSSEIGHHLCGPC